MLAYFAFLYVKAMYFAIYWMAVSTMVLYTLWGVDLDPTVVRGGPVIIAIIASAMTSEPNTVRRQIRRR